MGKLSRVDDIWVLSPTAEQRRRAANYASRTLPWTFNRMMKNTSPRGQQERALNIAKGIVVQEALASQLGAVGVRISLQRKSHRDEDFFDFNIVSGGRTTLLDVKSVAYYSDYPGVVRPPFSAQLVVDNLSYSGPDWRRFFPMLVPHTQIDQPKEGYIFAITKSIDFRRAVSAKQRESLIAAFPFGEHLLFHSNRRLCLAREQAGKGYFTTLELTKDSLFAAQVAVNVLYEWGGACKATTVQLTPGEVSDPIGPISVLNCVTISPEDVKALSGKLVCRVADNSFSDYVQNAKGENVNEEPETALVFSAGDFCNLMLPGQYEIYVLGWIRKQEFLEACRRYPAWVWPKDSRNRFLNQAWTQFTEKDISHLERAGFGDCISGSPKALKAGWMKTTGRGPGANCYVFPNTYRGGLKETNLYVLPQDLETMSSLGR